MRVRHDVGELRVGEEEYHTMANLTNRVGGGALLVAPASWHSEIPSVTARDAVELRSPITARDVWAPSLTELHSAALGRMHWKLARMQGTEFPSVTIGFPYEIHK